MKQHIMGLILAGGKSSRMGRDKAVLKPFGQNGPTMLESAFNLLEGIVSPCFVSCAKGKKYIPFPCIEDIGDQSCPAEGILAGLQKATESGFDGILALACDMPLMEKVILEKLLKEYLQASNNIWVTLYQSMQTGKMEMLATIYSINILPNLKAALSHGHKPLWDIAPANRIKRLPIEPQIARSFINCNSPDDLRRSYFQISH